MLQVQATFQQDTRFSRFIGKLADSPGMLQAGARGLTEHAKEQRRMSVTRIAAYTGVPKGRVAGVTKVTPARMGAGGLIAEVVTADKAVGLHEYGNPIWVRDMNPNADGVRGGSVSSMSGTEATGWNVRRQFKHAFVAKGRVFVRAGGTKLKMLSMAVLANELAKPSRPNVPAAEAFVARDLEQRVVRHLIRYLDA